MKKFKYLLIIPILAIGYILILIISDYSSKRSRCNNQIVFDTKAQAYTVSIDWKYQDSWYDKERKYVMKKCMHFYK